MAEPTGARLIVHAPDAPDLVYGLDQPVVRIGRNPAPQNDLVLPHSAVSRYHARLYCDRLPHRVQDVGSSNGTALNDLPLPPNEMHPLADGDVIGIGPFRLTYVAAPEPESKAAVVVEPAPGRPMGALTQASAAEAPAGGQPPTPPPEVAARPPEAEPWPGMPTDASRWLLYLPPLYAEDAFLGRYLLLFEDMLSAPEQTISHFDLFLDPETCPEHLVPMLAQWLGVEVAERWPLPVKRQLVKHGAWLHRARGTRPGLRRHLEICTGGTVAIEENVERPHTIVVRIAAPQEEIDLPLLAEVIGYHCPAHVGYTLRID